jgi:hypothetical protein
MKAFAVRQEDKSFADVIVRAADAADAKALIIKSEERCEFIEIPPDIATEMGLSEAWGRYEGAVSKWIVGPEGVWQRAVMAIAGDKLSTLIVIGLYKALQRLGADPDLLAIVGSYGDTLDNEMVLKLLREWNAGRPDIRRLVGIGRKW